MFHDDTDEGHKLKRIALTIKLFCIAGDLTSKELGVYQS